MGISSLNLRWYPEVYNWFTIYGRFFYHIFIPCLVEMWYCKTVQYSRQIIFLMRKHIFCDLSTCKGDKLGHTAVAEQTRTTVSPSLLLLQTRSLWALRAPTSRWRPFGPLDFVLRALRALRPCDPRIGDWIVC